MSGNRETGNGDPLRDVLRSWEVNEPLPPRFQELVWQRIERAEARSRSSVLRGLTRLVEVVLPQPKVAISYITLLLAVGMVAGAVAAQMKTSRLQADLSARYVHAIDPSQPHAPPP